MDGQDERPVNQEGEQTQAERHLNDFSSGHRLSNYPLGHRFDLVDIRNIPPANRMQHGRLPLTFGAYRPPAQDRA